MGLRVTGVYSGRAHVAAGPTANLHDTDQKMLCTAGTLDEKIELKYTKRTAAILRAVIFIDRYLVNDWEIFSFENRSEGLRFRALIQG